MEGYEQDSQQHIDVLEATRVLESFDIDCSGILSSSGLSTDSHAQHDVTRFPTQRYKTKQSLTGSRDDGMVSTVKRVYTLEKSDIGAQY
jgi:hypothetical protein